MRSEANCDNAAQVVWNAFVLATREETLTGYRKVSLYHLLRTTVIQCAQSERENNWISCKTGIRTEHGMQSPFAKFVVSLLQLSQFTNQLLSHLGRIEKPQLTTRYPYIYSYMKDSSGKYDAEKRYHLWVEYISHDSCWHFDQYHTSLRNKVYHPRWNISSTFVFSWSQNLRIRSRATLTEQ